MWPLSQQEPSDGSAVSKIGAKKAAAEKVEQYDDIYLEISNMFNHINVLVLVLESGKLLINKSSRCGQ